MVMVRFTFAILMGICLSGCGQQVSGAIAPDEVRVVVSGRHPFLRDHSRDCIVTRDGVELTRFPLYPDPGLGVHSNLYRAENGDYVLIDINGTWYEIDAEDGRLLQKEWKWNDMTPPDYLGVFEYDGTDEYVFYPALEKPEPEIYGFKDPGD